LISRRDLRAGLGLGFGRRDGGREYVVHEEDAAGRTASEQVPMVPIEEGEDGEPVGGRGDQAGEGQAEQGVAHDRRLNMPWHVRFELPLGTTTM